MSAPLCRRTADYQGDASSAVLRYAPHLFFQTGEWDFPAEPDLMRENARFRWSNLRGSEDYGWSKTLEDWVAGNDDTSGYFDVPWGTITAQAHRAHSDTGRPQGPQPCDPVTRPRDRRNLWGEGNGKGLFLELREGYARNGSGDVAAGQGVFHDAFVINSSTLPCVVLAYWFHFHYNWHVAMAHEGDWEHVSLVFEGDRLTQNAAPRYIYFAQHNAGELLDFASPRVEKSGGTHPKVYVSMWGHASYPPPLSPEQRADYQRSRQTWLSPIPSITAMPWHEFDGAWGEVGAKLPFHEDHSTGPLGPWFKRGNDRAIFERYP